MAITEQQKHIGIYGHLYDPSDMQDKYNPHGWNYAFKPNNQVDHTAAGSGILLLLGLAAVLYFAHIIADILVYVCLPVLLLLIAGYIYEFVRDNF